MDLWLSEIYSGNFLLNQGVGKQFERFQEKCSLIGFIHIKNQDACWLEIRAMGMAYTLTCSEDSMCMRARSLQSCPTLCDPIDCSPPGSSVHGVLQARILEWVAVPSSKGSSRPRGQTCISCDSCIEAHSLLLSHQGSPKDSTVMAFKAYPVTIILWFLQFW